MTTRSGRGAGPPVRQLPLGVALNATRRLDNFVPGPDAAAVAALQALLAGELAGHVYLQGSAGTGKTHLLQGCCAAAVSAGQRVAYLPLAQPRTLDPSLLSGMESATLLCLDDVDQLAGDGAWEQAVFRLYNEADAAGSRMLFAGRAGPQGLALADLRSRLRAALVISLTVCDDTRRAAVLRAQARERGVDLGDDVIHYVLARQPRDLGTLVALLEALDRYALVTQRRITVALVREYLEQSRDAG